MTARDPDWPIVDFLLQMRGDQEAGRARALRDYLDLHPEHQEAVAREYLLVRSLDQAGPPAADPQQFGTFRLTAELGRGGQGVVWLAHELDSARAVALKILHGRGHELDEARLLRETELAGRLAHDNLARVVSAGRCDGRLWIATEFVAGEPLAVGLEQRRQRGEPLLTGDAMRLCAALARGLHHAHGLGLAHRDVKPGNIVVRPDGTPVLTDFGSLRALAPDAALTRSGDLCGTPAYMAPEQLRGDPAGVRTDVWALGAVLYECLTLERPFAAPTVAATAQAVARREVWSLPGWALLQKDARAVLSVALAKDPHGRYASAAELAADCERVAAGARPLARRPGPVRRLLAFARHEPALATTSAAAVVLLCAALASALWFLSRERDLRQTLQAREQRVRSVAQSLLFELHGAVRDLPGAVAVRQRMLERARDALAELHAAAPDDQLLRRELITAWIRLGDVLGHGGVANKGDVDAARRCYETAADLARAGMAAGDERCRVQLGTTLLRRADLVFEQTEAARSLYQEALPLLGDADSVQRGLRASVFAALAQFDREAGDHSAALAACAEAERLFLADIDGSPALAAEVAGVRSVRATILLATDRTEEALHLLRAEGARLAELRPRFPHHVQFLVREAQNAVYLAQAEWAAGDRSAALAAAETAVLLRRQRVATDRDDLGAVHHLALGLAARARYRLGSDQPDLGLVEADFAEAADCAERAGFAEFAASLRQERDEVSR